MQDLLQLIDQQWAAIRGQLPALPLAEPVSVFALLMLIILIAPRLAAWGRLPGLIGLILAGLVLGPNALNIMQRDDTMRLFGAVGLLYIVFMAGLEINLGLFYKYKLHSGLFGLCTFLVPLGLGLLVGRYLLTMSWPSTTLLASMFASHTLISYPVAARFGILQNRAVVTTIGGTLITDTASLLLLAVIAASTMGALDTTFWVRLGVAAAIFVFLVLWVLPRIAQRFFRVVSGEGPTEYIFVLAAVFISALLARAAGIEPILGAFLAGLALNRLVPEQSPLMNRVQFVGNVLFIPMFLISVGMLVDLRVFLAGSRAWMVSAAMVLTVIAAKWLSARLAQGLLGYTRAEGWVMFGLSVNQAAATLAAVVVGMRIGLFDEAVLNGTIMMILATCILGPWVTEKFGRRVAEQSQEPVPHGEAPQRILVPLARPETATELLDLAFCLRPAKSESPIQLLTVVPDGPDVHDGVAASEKMLSQAVIHAAAADVPVHSATRVDLNIANGILRAVKELRITQVIVGWGGKSSTRERIFGSVLDQFLAQSLEMVLVCKIEQPVNTHSRLVLILPPLAEREPGFPEAHLAIRRLASQLGARLLVLATDNSLHRVKAQINHGLTARPAFQGITGWRHVLAEIAGVLKPDDLLVLHGARAGRLSWNPLLPSLPQRLARQFPATSFLVLYPSEHHYEATAAEQAPPPEGEADASLQPSVVLDLDEASHEIALARLIREAMPRFAAYHRALTRRVVQASREYACEIAPDVVLVHAEARDIDGPRLLIGVSREGLTFPKVRHVVHVILLLLKPATQSPEQHLRTLARVVHLLHQPQTIERLKNARSAQAAMDLVMAEL
ncbi:MAG: cation:proton antiporter [Phycisphaeraceae bacterium]